MREMGEPLGFHQEMERMGLVVFRSTDALRGGELIEKRGLETLNSIDW